MAKADETQEKIAELRKRRERIKGGGGKEAIEKQHHSGKLTARERLDLLLDADSFAEYNMHTTHQSRDFGMAERELPADGAVIGYGKINRRLAWVSSQDFTVMAGSAGEMHNRKLGKSYERALEMRVPHVGLYDSAGARFQEPMAGIYAGGRWIEAIIRNSGIVPQISALMGPCAGGPTYGPMLTDFIIMTRDTSYMYISAPGVVKSVTFEEVNHQSLGGAKVHAEISGCCDIIADDDRDCIRIIKELLSYFPQNNQEQPPFLKTGDDADRTDEELIKIVPASPKKSYDMHQVIRRVVDNGNFLEIKRDYARNIIVGFARMGGWSVGLVANQPQILSGAIDTRASIKAARFVQFCDAFNIPLVFLCDTPGYLPGKAQEHGGIPREGAKFLYTVADATVPKLQVVLRKGTGGAYISMGASSFGGDCSLAWPMANIGLMGAEAAGDIIFRKEAAQAANPEKLLEIRKKEFTDKFLNIYYTASRQDCDLVDDIIEPGETRPRLIKALEMTVGKKEERPWKKHGNMPT
ncbi:acyl-CoA carboxylase subunit beta [Chloroflexota bacterium]